MSAASGGRHESIARFVTGRRSKYLVVLIALLVAGGLSSLAGKVVLTSDPAELLPKRAESVRALRAIERFPSGDVTSAVIVGTRPGGLTERDREALRELETDVPGAGDASPPRESENGSVAVVVVPFTDVGEDALVAAVETLRDRLAALEDGGLETHLTGSARFTADVSDVFGGTSCSKGSRWRSRTMEAR